MVSITLWLYLALTPFLARELTARPKRLSAAALGGCYVIRETGSSQGTRRHLPPSFPAHWGGRSPHGREIQGSAGYKTSQKHSSELSLAGSVVLTAGVHGAVRRPGATSSAQMFPSRLICCAFAFPSTLLCQVFPGCPWASGSCASCAQQGSGNPPPPCELCLSLVPVNRACRLCASRLFDYNYHSLLYTGCESPEQLRAPSRRARTNDKRETIAAQSAWQSRGTCKGQEKPFLEDKHRGSKALLPH